eukprot:5848791-Pyramimonas_sp.AAC.2
MNPPPPLISLLYPLMNVPHLLMNGNYCGWVTGWPRLRPHNSWLATGHFLRLSVIFGPTSSTLFALPFHCLCLFTACAFSLPVPFHCLCLYAACAFTLPVLTEERLRCAVEGFYYDPNSSPYQRLQLKACCEGRSGQSFASYSFR